MDQNAHFVFSERDLAEFKKSKREGRTLTVLGILILIVSMVIVPTTLYLYWKDITTFLNQGIEEKFIEARADLDLTQATTDLEKELLKKSKAYLELGQYQIKSVWIILISLVNSALFTAGVGTICTGYSINKVLKVVYKYVDEGTQV